MGAFGIGPSTLWPRVRSVDGGVAVGGGCLRWTKETRCSYLAACLNRLGVGRFACSVCMLNVQRWAVFFRAREKCAKRASMWNRGTCLLDVCVPLSSEMLSFQVSSTTMSLDQRIEQTDGICGGKPRIADHRIRVQDVVVLARAAGLERGSDCQ